MQNCETCKLLPNLPWSILSIPSRVCLHHFKSTEQSPCNTAEHGNAIKLCLRAALSQLETDKPQDPKFLEAAVSEGQTERQCRTRAFSWLPGAASTPWGIGHSTWTAPSTGQKVVQIQYKENRIFLSQILYSIPVSNSNKSYDAEELLLVQRKVKNASDNYFINFLTIYSSNLTPLFEI